MCAVSGIAVPKMVESFQSVCIYVSLNAWKGDVNASLRKDLVNILAGLAAFSDEDIDGMLASNRKVTQYVSRSALVFMM